MILHKLRPSKKVLKDFYVFDVETTIRKGSKMKYELRARPENFYFGVVYGYNYCKVITSIDEFKKEFEKPRYYRKKVFAHNAFYDLTTLFDNIYKFDPHAIFNGRFICASNGNCMFADSMNIYQTSARNIGKILGKEKLFLNDGNLDQWFDGNSIPEKDIEYCIRDCEIIYEALLMAFEFAGEIKITQASLSMSYFRRYHLPFRVEHDEKQDNFFNSYFGGRVEAFFIGKTKASVYDINSSYPFAMKNARFPNPKFLREFKSNTPKRAIKYIIENLEGVICCDIKHRDVWLGYLPHKVKGKLLFPVGRFSGWFNLNEIRFALEHEIIEIENVHSIFASEPMETIFSSFVDLCYNKRFESGNDFEAYRYKIFLNSLYGKFAQKIDQQSVYIEDLYDSELIEDFENKGILISIDNFNTERNDAFATISVDAKKFPYSIPSFASYITSFSRIHLLKKMIKEEYNGVQYCDTDSVFLEKDFTDNETFLDEKGIPILGAWKRENKIVTEIRGLKNYDFYKENQTEIIKRRIKGIPDKAEYINGEYVYYSLVTTKESLRRGIDAGINMKRKRKLVHKYDKRIVLKNGETKPIRLQ